MISNDYQNLISNVKFKNLLDKYDLTHKFIKDYSPTSVIDFGCSKGNLLKKIKEDFSSINEIYGYDPGVPEYSNLPNKSYDVLISTDVLEHIEPKFLNETLQLIESLFNKSAWLIIACYPAKKKLLDGRNAHLIVKSPEWWVEKINSTFNKSKIVYKETTYITTKKDNTPKLELRLILEKI
jgi:DNA-binding Lrp family transcriptional regulator